MNIEIPQFSNKNDLHKWLVQNKELIIATKKAELKRADVLVHMPTVLQKVVADKAEGEAADVTEINVELAINSSNWLDSHLDVHIPSLWDKSIKELKTLYLLQEHRMTFDKIISDELKASTKTFSFKELGVDVDGTSEVLVFSGTIKNDRNPFMFNQYRKGWVRNHSVGMRYVKLYFCLDSDEPWAASDKDNWSKYYPMIANKDVADSVGYFWAVTEAKIIEGSAVPIGSNIATPTISVNDKAATGTLHIEPPQSTHPKAVNWEKVAAALR
jgi:hypothetical protein